LRPAVVIITSQNTGADNRSLAKRKDLVMHSNKQTNLYANVCHVYKCMACTVHNVCDSKKFQKCSFIKSYSNLLYFFHTESFSL